MSSFTLFISLSAGAEVQLKKRKKKKKKEVPIKAADKPRRERNI